MASGVERYLLEFNDALVAGAERRERILAEVEEHLRDATDALVATGLPAGEAELEPCVASALAAQAAERFGADPLGRGQQASRLVRGKADRPPVGDPPPPVRPLIALSVWWTTPMAVWLWVWLLASHTHRNIRTRRATGATALPGRLGSSQSGCGSPIAGRWSLAQRAGLERRLRLFAVTWSGSPHGSWRSSGYYVACGWRLAGRGRAAATPSRASSAAAGGPEARIGRDLAAVRSMGAGARGTAPADRDRAGGSGSTAGLTLLALASVPRVLHAARRGGRAAWLRDRRPRRRWSLRTTPLLERARPSRPCGRRPCGCVAADPHLVDRLRRDDA